MQVQAALIGNRNHYSGTTLPINSEKSSDKGKERESIYPPEKSFDPVKIISESQNNKEGSPLVERKRNGGTWICEIPIQKKYVKFQIFLDGISKIFFLECLKIPGENLCFHRRITEQDENCGLGGLARNRKELVETLLDLERDFEARNALYEEIYKALMNKEIKPPDESWNQLLNNYNAVKKAEEDLIREVREKIESHSIYTGR